MKFSERGTFHGIECGDILKSLSNNDFLYSLMTEWN